MNSFLSDFYPSKKSNLKTAGTYKPEMKVSFHTFIKFRSFDEEKDVKEILSLEENSVTEEAFAKLNNVQLITYVNPPMLNSRRIIEEHKRRLNLSPYSSYPSSYSSYSTAPTNNIYKNTYVPISSIYPSRSSSRILSDQSNTTSSSSTLNNRRYNNSYSVSTLPSSTPLSPTFTKRSVFSSPTISAKYNRPNKFQSSLTPRFSGTPSSNYLR